MSQYLQKEVLSLKGGNVMLSVSYSDALHMPIEKTSWGFSIMLMNPKTLQYEYMGNTVFDGRRSAVLSEAERINRVLEYVTREQILELQLELWEKLKPTLFTEYKGFAYDGNGKRIKVE
jgi:hypothetical protein